MFKSIMVEKQVGRITIYFLPQKYSYDLQKLREISIDGIFFADILKLDLQYIEAGMITLLYNPVVSDEYRAEKIAEWVINSLIDKYPPSEDFEKELQKQREIIMKRRRERRKNTSDTKDVDDFQKYVNETEAKLRDKNAQIKSAFEKGLMSKSERHDERMKALEDCITELRIVRRKGSCCSDEDCKKIEERFETATGIRRVYKKEHPIDLGFDQMEWLSWKYEGIEGFEKLWEEEDLLGKTYEMVLLLKNGAEVARVKYEVRVESVKNEFNQDGSRHLLVRGFGKFPGYYGDASLLVKNVEGRLTALVSQGINEDREDPIWERKKPELVDVLHRVDEEEVSLRLVETESNS